MQIPIKKPAGFPVETNKLILTFILKRKGARIAKTISKNNNEAGELTPPRYHWNAQ